MNDNIKSKIVIGFGVFLAFLVGVGFGSDGPCPDPKVVTKEVEVVKEVCSQEDEWKRLKKVDDQIIYLDGEVELKAAKVLEDVINGNFTELEDDSEWMSHKVGEKEVLMRTRSELLGQLGY